MREGDRVTVRMGDGKKYKAEFIEKTSVFGNPYYRVRIVDADFSFTERTLQVPKKSVKKGW